MRKFKTLPLKFFYLFAHCLEYVDQTFVIEKNFIFFFLAKFPFSTISDICQYGPLLLCPKGQVSLTSLHLREGSQTKWLGYDDET